MMLISIAKNLLRFLIQKDPKACLKYHLYTSPFLTMTLWYLAVSFGLINPPGLSARDLFELTAESEGATSAKGFSDIENFANQLDNAGLNALIPAYLPDQSAARAVLDVRGLPAVVEYEVNNATLNFTVPSLGIDLNFTGATRDASQDLFLDFLKGEGSSILTRLLQGLVEKTAVDPVAGNPNSLMAQMAGMDYEAGTATIDIDDEGSGAPRLFGISLIAGTSEATAFRTNMVSLPINYIIPLEDPRRQLIIDLPLRYLDVEGAGVYDGSLGIGFRFPIFENLLNPAVRWSLMPMVRAGVIGSENMGALQAVYSGSTTSKIKFLINDLTLSLNNMISYYQTGAVGGDYSEDYDLENVIFRNGLALEGSLALTVFDEPASWELQFIDTRISGDDWFIDGYNELALTFGTRRREDRMTWQSLRIGAKYTFADEYDSFQFVLGFRF